MRCSYCYILCNNVHWLSFSWNFVQLSWGLIQTYQSSRAGDSSRLLGFNWQCQYPGAVLHLLYHFNSLLWRLAGSDWAARVWSALWCRSPRIGSGRLYCVLLVASTYHAGFQEKAAIWSLVYISALNQSISVIEMCCMAEVFRAIAERAWGGQSFKLWQ